MKLLYCVIYLASIGVASQLIGMCLPRRWFDPNSFIYRPRKFEKNGRIYDALKIKSWKSHLPDMSRIIKKMAPKQIKSILTAEKADRMARETCVAELVHSLLALLGFACLFIWKGVGGAVVWVVYILGNLPFIIIQRYNRPRYMAVHSKLEGRENMKRIGV